MVDKLKTLVSPFVLYLRSIAFHFILVFSSYLWFNVPVCASIILMPFKYAMCIYISVSCDKREFI